MVGGRNEEFVFDDREIGYSVREARRIGDQTANVEFDAMVHPVAI